MKRTVALLPALAALILVAPAHAAKPEVVEAVRFDGTVTELDPFFGAAAHMSADRPTAGRRMTRR